MALYDRVKFATATTGAGAITVGAALLGYRTPAQASVPDGGTFTYVIEDGADWEIGTGTYTASGTTVARTLIASSTGSLLNLTGNAIMYISAIAQKLAYDYDEQPYTPALTFNNAAVGVTYSSRSGSYTRMGRLIFVNIALVLSSKGSSTGLLQISLPFAAAATYYPKNAVDIIGSALALSSPMVQAVAGSAQCSFKQYSGTTTTDLNNTHIANTTSFYFSLIYTV